MKRASMLLKIPFFDVDAYRVVWHGNYPKYIEMARCHLLDQAGCPYSLMEKEGFFFPVVDLQVKYVKPLLFEQEVRLDAWFVEWENRLRINYEIRDCASNTVYSKAKTTQFAIAMPEQITQYDSPPFLIEKITAWMQN